MTHKFYTLAMLALAALTLTMTSCQKEDPIVSKPSETTKTSTESSAKTKAIVNIFQNENGNYCAQAVADSLPSSLKATFSVSFSAVYKDYQKTLNEELTSEMIDLSDGDVHIIVKKRVCEEYCLNKLKGDINYPQDRDWRLSNRPFITPNFEKNEYEVTLKNDFNERYSDLRNDTHDFDDDWQDNNPQTPTPTTPTTPTTPNPGTGTDAGQGSDTDPKTTTLSIFKDAYGNYCAKATGGNLEESPMTLSFTLTFYAVYNGYAKTESRSMTTERIRFNDNSIHYLARQRDCETDCINWLKNNVRPSYPQDGGWKFNNIPYITINGDVDENVVIDNAFNQKYPFNM